MSSASLAVSTRPHPDPTRIAAISAAIVFNLAALLIASRPMLPATPLALVHALRRVPVIRLIEPPAVLRPVAPVLPQPLHHAVATTHVSVRPHPLSVPAPLLADSDATPAAPPATAPSAAPLDTAPVASGVTAAVEASLAYRSAPLQFPLQALRLRMHGLVLLRVLVDETGKPVDVIVERSSGYPMLDRSAREQVLAAWRFQPASVNGRAVRAWARVPVNFDLHAQ
jgi:protein TonB